MRLAIEQPEWLWVLALALPLALLARQLPDSISRARRASIIALRVAWLAAIALVLARASGVRPVERVSLVVVVDASESVRRLPGVPDPDTGRPRGIGERVAELLRAGGGAGDDRLAIVAFAGVPSLVASPGHWERVASRDILPTAIHASDRTNIASALSIASAMLLADAGAEGGGDGSVRGRLLLISDGRETEGDALAAARDIASRHAIPIDVVPIRYDLRPEVMVESIDAPASARGGVVLRVALASPGPIRGLLRLEDSGVPIDLERGRPGSTTPRRIDAEPGVHVEIVETLLAPGRVHRLRATFEPDAGTDTLTTNNEASALSISPGGDGVLIVDPSFAASEPASSTLAGALRAGGLGVEVVSPASLAPDLVALSAHALVVLYDVPADDVPVGVQAALDAYVRELGGGVIVVGGPNSFAAGGWKGSRLEALLPVELDLPERLARPEGATIFVLDNSGSMGLNVMGSSRTQQRIANEAAAMAVRSLDPRDHVGVIAFNSDHRTIVPLGPNADAAATGERIESIAPGGGTSLAPPLREAIALLEAHEAKVRHVVVLTDGRSSDADELPEIARRMRERSITLSAIAIGDAADADSLRQMATLAGGTFYEVTNPNVLPRIMIRAVRIVRSPLVREEAFTPVLTTPRSPATIELPQPPMLGGLALATRLDHPTVLTPIVTPEGEPVLAHWSVELGRVGAFTSDAHRWGAGWTTWEGFTPFWTGLARTIARPAGAGGGGAEVEARFDGDAIDVRVRLADANARPIDDRSPSVRVFTPDDSTGAGGTIHLVQTGPGEYAGRWIPPSGAAAPGDHVLVVRAGEGIEPVVAGLPRPASPEDRTLASDEPRLRAIAEATGGRVIELGTSAGLFEREGLAGATSRRPLWPWLIPAALVLLWLDVATRRVAWDRLIDRAARRDAAAAIALAAADRTNESLGVAARVRGRSGVAPTARLLNDEDAEEVRREARRRRIESLRAAAREEAAGIAGSGAGAAGSAPDPAASSDAPRAEEGARNASQPDLREAKRRARERFGDGDAPPA